MWRTTRVNWTLTGVLSCWLGTPLLSDAANGFIMEKKKENVRRARNLTSRSFSRLRHGPPSSRLPPPRFLCAPLPSLLPPAGYADSLKGGGGDRTQGGTVARSHSFAASVAPSRCSAASRRKKKKQNSSIHGRGEKQREKNVSVQFRAPACALCALGNSISGGSVASRRCKKKKKERNEKGGIKEEGI